VIRLCRFRFIGFLFLGFLKPLSAATGPDTLFGVSLGGNSAHSNSVPLQIVLLLTALTLLPAIVMCLTPFLRITVVLHFLRQALGTQTVPSNQILVGIALFLTMLIMRPVLDQMYRTSWQPMQEGKLTAQQAFDDGAKPLKAFMLRFTREKDIRLFVEISKDPPPKTPQDVSLSVVIPAYITSELRTGFQIGAVLYLPFLVLDLVVASVTLSVGMVQLPPAMVSAPLKILLFVLVDGWNLVIGSLVKTFG
jgi:flagellar biosynthesis protein FliP